MSTYTRKGLEYCLMIYELIQKSQTALLEKYAEKTITIPESEKWDYAIADNYTNYQDGFIMPDCDEYRGLPLFDHPDFGRLYLRWDVPFHVLQDNEREKYLCFDRYGNKYTVIVLKETLPNGNPSYFRILPKIKPYRPKRRK